jgi:hypothetical protein
MSMVDRAGVSQPYSIPTAKEPTNFTLRGRLFHAWGLMLILEEKIVAKPFAIFLRATRRF